MFSDGEEFLAYLLSTNKDQPSNCQELVIWQNEGYESEESVSVSYLFHYCHIRTQLLVG